MNKVQMHDEVELRHVHFDPVNNSQHIFSKIPIAVFKIPPNSEEERGNI